MRVIHQLSELAEPVGRPGSVVTIGNFDGVHLAHQELFRGVVQAARACKAPAVALTFNPHPAQILAPERSPKILTPLATKVPLIAEQGLDVLWILPFTQEVARLSPIEFVERVLLRELRALEMHVGSNFCFGYKRQGNTDLLIQLGRERGFGVKVLPMIEVRGQAVSSSRIRELLNEGKIGLANRLLGRAYRVAGPLVAGQGVGHKLTVPTLNLASDGQQLPKPGVYVSQTRAGADWRESVTNVGTKPTFGVHPLTVESHLLNFAGEISVTQLQVEFLYRLRDEIKFPNPAALKAQIHKDASRSLKYFRLRKLFAEAGSGN